MVRASPTRAPPGFGAAARWEPGQAPLLRLRPSPGGDPRRARSEPERSGTEAPRVGPAHGACPRAPRRPWGRVDADVFRVLWFGWD